MITSPRRVVGAAVTAVTVVYVSAAVAAFASPITFTFEEQSLAASTTLITSTQDGLTATIERADHTAIAIVDLPPNKPASWGNRAISDFAGSFGPGAMLIIDFSESVSVSGISFGDYGGDDDSPVVLTAYSGLNGTGSNLGSQSVAYPESLFIGNGDTDVRSLSINAADIRSLTILGGGSFPNSLYFDNLVADSSAALPVPDTGSTASLLLLGTGLLGIARRRLRSHA
jgi:hypothetical protein